MCPEEEGVDKQPGPIPHKVEARGDLKHHELPGLVLRLGLKRGVGGRPGGVWGANQPARHRQLDRSCG